MQRLVAACVLPLVFCADARAGEHDAPRDLAAIPLDALLDMEVSGASKFTLRVSDAAPSVSVISAEQMRALGIRTLADALQTLRGLVLSSDRTYHYINVRGLASPGDYNTRVLVLVDGNRINDTIYSQAYLGTEFPVDIDLVERVEFVPGQGSAVHGGNALYGVVNVVTRHPAQGAPRELAVALAPGDTQQARATGRLGVGAEGALMLSVSGLHMAGTDLVHSRNPDVVSHHSDHEHDRQALAKFSGMGLAATFIHSDRVKGLTARTGTVFDDPRNVYHDRETLLDVSLTRPIDATSRWRLRGYAGTYDFTGDYAVESVPPVINRDTGKARWWGVEGNWFTERIADHKIVVGMDWQHSAKRDQGNQDLDPPAVHLDDHRSGYRVALFAEDQWTPVPALTMTLGGRYDRLESGEARFSPRLAGVWRASERVILKASHGRAFRPANAYESFYTAEPYQGNPDLQPETVSGHEITAELRPDRATRATLTAYSNRGRKLIVQTLDPIVGTVIFENSGAFRAYGVETEIEHGWDNGAWLRANYSWHRVEGESAELVGGRNPVHLAKLIATLPFPGRWTAGLQTILVGRRGTTPGYGTTGVTLTHALAHQRGDLSVSLDDVFDRRPAEPGSDTVLQGSTVQYGRGLRVKLRWAF